MLKRLSEIQLSRLEPLVRFLPLVLDKLLLLMVRPPSVAGHVLNVAQASFNAIAAVVRKIQVRNRTGYILLLFTCQIPRFPLSCSLPNKNFPSCHHDPLA